MRSNELAEHEADAYVTAMRGVATSVTIVSTARSEGCVAQTVSAMSSVCVEPPVLLACVNRRSPVEAAIAATGVFAVSVLAADQAHVADVFAGRATAVAGPYDFSCTTWIEHASGCPVVAGAVAWFDCRLESRLDVGSHAVLLGAVQHSGRTGGTPLVYCERDYARPLPLAA